MIYDKHIKVLSISVFGKLSIPPLLLYKAHALIYFSELVLCHCLNLIETIALFICVKFFLTVSTYGGPISAYVPIHSTRLSCRISRSRPIDSSMVATFLFIIVKRYGIIKMFSNNSTIAQMI